MSAFTWPPEPPTLAGIDNSAAAGRPAAGQPTPAAVLVPLFRAGERPEPHVVLTRRRADLRRHAGEIAFPGGRRDDGDPDLEHTALREAEEEIGLPRASVTLLGTLEPVSTFATGYVIHPYVAEIPAGLAWRPSAQEVDAVLELPLAALREGRARVPIERRGITFQTDAYVVGEHLIWGATARIIQSLLERVDAKSSPGPPTLTNRRGHAPSGD